MTDKFTAGPFDHNGAAVLAECDARGRLRFAVFSAAGGDPVRLMRDRDAAIAFAQSLPIPEGLEPIVPPSPIGLSPRAHPALRAERGLPPEPVAEPADGAPSRSMSPARARSGAGPSASVVGVASRPRERT
jgi:hypothetical protein